MLLVGYENVTTPTAPVNINDVWLDIKMQYNTVGRERKASVSSVSGVSGWFYSLRRAGKKAKHSGGKAVASSRSDWDLTTLSRHTSRLVCLF